MIAASPAGLGGLSLVAVCALAFAALLGLLLVALLGPGLRAQKRARQARLDELHRYRLVGAYGGDAPAERRDPSPEHALTTRTLALVDKAVRARGRRPQIVTKLERSGLRLRPEEWVAIQLAAVVGGAALAIFVFSSVLGIFVGAPLGWLGCWGFLRVKTTRRLAAFEAQLPDALQLVAGALRAGFALNQSLATVVREGHEPVAAEFGRALQEVRLGALLPDALDGLAARMQSADLALVAMAIRTSYEVGGNLAEVLQGTVVTMRERTTLRGQVKVLSAEGRLSAKVLTGLPVLLAVYLFSFKREYLAELYMTGLGVVLLTGGVVLLAVGTFWLHRLTKIEV